MLLAAHDALDHTLTIRRAERLFRPLQECDRSFAREVHDAPGDLDPVAEATREACGKGERAIAEFETARYAALRPMRAILREAHLSFLDAANRLDQRIEMTRRLPTLGGRTAESRVEPVLTRAATAIATFPTEVRCWSTEDWPAVRREVLAFNPEYPRDTFFYGVAGIWGGAANLWPGACAQLVRFVYDRRPALPRRGAALVEAFQTLGHEIAHASGVVEEPVAECHGLQHVRHLARALGAERVHAGRLARAAWRRYLDNDFYRTPRCRNGASLDLRSGETWP